MPILLSPCSRCFSSSLSFEKSHQGDRWNVKFSAYVKMQLTFSGTALQRHKDGEEQNAWQVATCQTGPPWYQHGPVQNCCWCVWRASDWYKCLLSVCVKPWGWFWCLSSSTQWKTEVKQKGNRQKGDSRVLNWLWLTGLEWFCFSFNSFVSIEKMKKHSRGSEERTRVQPLLFLGSV